MSQKLISVIIPTYNRAEMVVEAIKSVLAQSYKPIQIIVADDGSTDDTAERVAEFEGVEYYRQVHTGHAAARNLGLSHANGEYIASLDSDDVWDEDFLKVAVEAIERFAADFVFLNWRDSYDGIHRPSEWARYKELQKCIKGNSGDWTQLDAKRVRTLYLWGCPSPSSALLIRRSSIATGWNEKMKIADDWYLILEMVLSQPSRAALCSTPMWTKTVHTNNIYHGRDEFEVARDFGVHDLAMIVRDFHKQLTFQERSFLKKELSLHYFNYGRLGMRRGGTPIGLDSFWTSFVLAPFSSIFYMLRLPVSHLKHRVRTARNKPKKASENLVSKPSKVKAG
jgi:glycosyltransferase involved in cell wall biosynthesis